ncbi:MAG: hypothetical protein OFPII_44340 [Osedax symbiont Rs1]|nr:MAG: hypothetical protein OFPII_44340 [Osedax symbiont Rs1]
MEGLDDKYYIISRDGTKDETVSAKPDEETARLPMGVRPIPSGRAMFFSLGHAEQHKKLGLGERIGDLIFRGSDFMIKKEVRNKLLKYPIDHIQYYPAVYTEVDGTSHYNYFFVNTTQRKDWCYIERSTLDEFAEEMIDEGLKPSVETITLDFHKMLLIPEDERLIFRMSNIDMDKIIIHEKVKDIFEQFNLVDTRFFRVDQWKRNAHLRPA